MAWTLVDTSIKGVLLFVVLLMLAFVLAGVWTLAQSYLDPHRRDGRDRPDDDEGWDD